MNYMSICFGQNVCFHVTFNEFVETVREKGNFMCIIQYWGHKHTHVSYT